MNLDYSDEEVMEEIPQLREAIEEAELEQDDENEHAPLKLPQSTDEVLECYSGHDLSTVLNKVGERLRCVCPSAWCALCFSLIRCLSTPCSSLLLS
jgi:hypothetical protein